jgi:hypothetical protein
MKSETVELNTKLISEVQLSSDGWTASVTITFKNGKSIFISDNNLSGDQWKEISEIIEATKALKV